MSSAISMKQFRHLFRFRDQTEESRQIATKTARECLDKVVKQLNRDSESWSAAKLRGYLRAIAIPWIDLEMEEILIRHPRNGGHLSTIRNLAIDILEQLVIQKLKTQSAAFSTEAAAA